MAYSEPYLPVILMRVRALVPIAVGRTGKGEHYVHFRNADPPTEGSLLEVMLIDVVTTKGMSQLHFQYVIQEHDELVRYRGIYGDPRFDSPEPYSAGPTTP